MEFVPCRAAGHRSYIAPKFGAGGEGGQHAELTMDEIMGNPRTAKLGIEVALKLQHQFMEFGESRDKNDADVLRQQLEALANTLEILLDETIRELEALGGA